jgi:hypothetical protein
MIYAASGCDRWRDYDFCLKVLPHPLLILAKTYKRGKIPKYLVSSCFRRTIHALPAGLRVELEVRPVLVMRILLYTILEFEIEEGRKFKDSEIPSSCAVVLTNRMREQLQAIVYKHPLLSKSWPWYCWSE